MDEKRLKQIVAETEMLVKEGDKMLHGMRESGETNIGDYYYAMGARDCRWAYLDELKKVL